MDESASLDSGTIGKAARKRKEDAQNCVLHRVEEAAWKQNPHSCKMTGSSKAQKGTWFWLMH